MILSNPLTGQFLVVNHPGHSDQSVHGKKRQSLRDRFEKPMGGGRREIAEILQPFGFSGPRMTAEGPEVTSSLGTPGKRVRVEGSRDNEYTPDQASVMFEDDKLGTTEQRKRLSAKNLKFLRKLKGMVAVLDREGVSVDGSPADSKRRRLYEKSLRSINIPEEKNPYVIPPPPPSRVQRLSAEVERLTRIRDELENS